MRIGHWLTELWTWVVPALAALDPMVAAYSAGYFQGSLPSALNEPAALQSTRNTGVVIPGPFQAAGVAK